MQTTRSTRTVKEKEITRNWHLVDLKGQILGRGITQVAKLLQGKDKRNYVPNLDAGDYVVVINAAGVKVTGKKPLQKIYDSYSGYPGGRRVVTYKDLMARDPEKVVRLGISGMLPKNKHRDPRLARLFIFKDDKHTYSDKFQTK